MARKVRIEFPGARYHTFNRGCGGNLVFENAATAREFEGVLFDAVQAYGWRLYGYVLLPDRFHLAVETPQGNLGPGMHWLQSTFSNRRNRTRGCRGPLFEGRFRGLLVEEGALMARLVEALHLLPLLEEVVGLDQFSRFRWSSLHHWLRPGKGAPLASAAIEAGPSQTGSASGPGRYVAALVQRFERERASLEREVDSFGRGWALGSAQWRQALARRWLAGGSGADLASVERRAVAPDLWGGYLEKALAAHGRTLADLEGDRKGAAWKIALARELRARGASYPWLAAALHMGQPNSVRAYVNRKE